MTRPGLRTILLSIVFCCYLAAVLAVIFGLVDLNVNRYGSLHVSRATVETDGATGQFLRLEGDGFVDGIRAVLVSEPFATEQDVFLDGRLTQGLWSDGHFLLCSYRRNLLLSVLIADDGSPQVLGSLALPGRIKQLLKVEDRALVFLSEGGFCVVSLSDPARPELAGTLLAGALHTKTIRDMVTDGRRVYMPSKQGNLIIVDMAAQNPTATFLPAADQPWRAALYGNRLVTGSLDGEVVLYVLDTAGLPTPVGRFSFESDVRGIAINAYGLFIALGNGELHSFDTRTWPRPEHMSVLVLNGHLLNLSGVQDRPLLLLSRASRGLLTIDVSNLSAPEEGPEFTRVSTVWDFCIVGDKVYFVSKDSVGSFSLDNIVAGSGERRIALDTYDYVIYKWDNDLFLLYTGDKSSADRGGEETRRRLQTVTSLADPQPCISPEPTAKALDAEDCLAVYENRNREGLYLFCRDRDEGEPRLAASLAATLPTVALWKRGAIYVLSRNHASIINPQHGMLRVYDARNPRRPEVTGELVMAGSPLALDWLEPHFLLVAAGSAGLYVVDVQDPSRPELVANLPLPGHLRKISSVVNVIAAGGKAYLAHQRSGVSMVNLTDPRQPFFERMLDTPGFAKQMAVQGDLLLVSLYQQGIFLIDISNEVWAPVGVLETTVTVLDLAVRQGRVYIAGGAGGLVQISMPRRVEVRRQDSAHARIVLPDDLSPGSYRLYVYTDTENVQVGSAFQIAAGPTGVAQNE